MPVRVSEMGKQYIEIIDAQLAQQREQGEANEQRSAY